MQCAQEIISLFLLAVAAEVESVAGETTRQQQSEQPIEGRTKRNLGRTRLPRTVTNSVLLELAQEIVDTTLAHDITEAYTLVIPAFAHYNLLPIKAEGYTNLDQDGVEAGGDSGDSLAEGGPANGNCQDNNIDLGEAGL